MSNPGLLPHSVISKPLLDELAGASVYGGGQPPRGRLGTTFADPGDFDRDPLYKVVLRLAGHSMTYWKYSTARLENLFGAARARAEVLPIGGALVACTMARSALLQVVNMDLQHSIDDRILSRIWPDFQVQPLLYRSLETIGAARILKDHAASGRGIVWAVIDSGIDQEHHHFKTYDTLGGPVAELHRDFTGGRHWQDGPGESLTDSLGHGTHVAGIIAGSLVPLPYEPAADEFAEMDPDFGVYGHERMPSSNDSPAPTDSGWGDVADQLLVERRGIDPRTLRGVAPLCKLVSLKVLGTEQDRSYDLSDRTEHVIRALRHVLDVNSSGRVIHGVNLSLGYEFGPNWPDCGRSPLCEVVEEVVASGVVVVAAAGNTGYGLRRAEDRTTLGGLAVTINDPGNAEHAITVGSTSGEDPHAYGVSYFSSKGPTADGRPKPDLLAPGERITSCATLRNLDNAPESALDHRHSNYVELSGTSQAAPHVSGGIAAFLSAHGRYIGQPDLVKDLILRHASPLRRDPQFEGKGLLRMDAVLAAER